MTGSVRNPSTQVAEGDCEFETSMVFLSDFQGYIVTLSVSNERKQNNNKTRTSSILWTWAICLREYYFPCGHPSSDSWLVYHMWVWFYSVLSVDLFLHGSADFVFLTRIDSFNWVSLQCSLLHGKTHLYYSCFSGFLCFGFLL